MKLCRRRLCTRVNSGRSAMSERVVADRQTDRQVHRHVRAGLSGSSHYIAASAAAAAAAAGSRCDGNEVGQRVKGYDRLR